LSSMDRCVPFGSNRDRHRERKRSRERRALDDSWIAASP
jgi:hypothetical protein